MSTISLHGSVQDEQHHQQHGLRSERSDGFPLGVAIFSVIGLVVSLALLPNAEWTGLIAF
jgi:hypothetical protein